MGALGDYILVVVSPDCCCFVLPVSGDESLYVLVLLGSAVVGFCMRGLQRVRRFVILKWQ